MSKLKCVIYCPIDCYSGYSAHSRDLVKQLIELKQEEWDIKIMPCNWGNTPHGFIQDNQQEWGFLIKHILPTPQLTYLPDIWIMITVPNEFQRTGKYNIGVTAGIETTICDASWVEGINRMDLTLVSSNHAKNVFLNSKFEKRDQNNQLVGKLEVEKPIQVLGEGVDINKYKFLDKVNIDLSQIKEDFCYLFVGSWLQGNLGEDRKNVGLLVKTFYETFKNKKNKPALILKTHGASASYPDRESILSKINQIKETINGQTLPNVYLLHGDLSDEDMNELYNHPKVKVMVNLTKGEGYGRPLLEFSLSKKPIICSGYSGPLDFLNREFCLLLPGQLTPIDKSAQVANMLIENSQWFSPDLMQVNNALIESFDNYKIWKEKANRQAYYSKTKFSLDKMKEELELILKTHLPDFPKPIKLVLPDSLKKISLPKKIEKVEKDG